MVVISEQTVGVNEPAARPDYRPERPQKKGPIPVIAKDAGALVPAADDVVERSGELEPQWADHLPRVVSATARGRRGYFVSGSLAKSCPL
jgi:hypothetical protein